MLRNMRIGTKILATFALALPLLAFVGGLAWWSANGIGEALADVGDTKLRAVQALGQINEAKTEVGRGLSTVNLRRADAAMRRTSRGDTGDALKTITHGLETYEKLPRSPEADVLWQAVKTSHAGWRTSAESVIAMSDERDRLLGGGAAADAPAVKALDDRMWEAFRATFEKAEVLESAVDKLAERVAMEAGTAVAAGHAVASRGILIIVAAGLLGAALVAAIGIALGRSIGNTVRTLVSEAGRLRDAVAEGKLDVRGDVAKVDLEFRGVVQGMNETLDAYAKPMRVITGYMTRIAKGDVPPPITDRYLGDFDIIKEALNRCVAALSGLIAEMTRMVEAQAKGDSDAFVDEARFEGAFRAMAHGVNESTRMHVRNLVDGLAVLGKYGEGDFKPVMRPLPGKQALMNETFDRIRANLMGVAVEVQALTRAAVEGKLSTRADASRLSGDWKGLVEGVNATLDAVIGPLEVAARHVEQISNGQVPAKITEHYAGDFGRIKDSLNRCIDAVNRLVLDANGLAEAAAAGKLQTRADAGRHHGDFRKIVDGVNRTLEAVVAPVNEAAQVLERLSQRDLCARMNGSYEGELARIKESVNLTAGALHDALAQVAASVDQVSSAATQIASSSQAVASGASEQAASLEESSSSIESVAAMVKTSAESAQQANTLTQAARAAATEGATAVEQMQAAMGRIKQSAEGTSLIIKDVSDIAFQTNLLALNAAVEAARAGEAGRGFAVVAEEVRSLALRAKEAASKTEELIRQSVKQAGEGEGAAKHVAGKLGEIVQGVEKVTAIVAEIAAAAKEQTTAVEQVNKAVGEMDRVTQQNAASAEESSSAASELSGQAEQLAEMVGSFRLERAAARAVPAAAPPAKTAAPARANGARNGHARPPSHDELFPMGSDKGLRDF
jgi:methyl-accepting chemotaxis protein